MVCCLVDDYVDGITRDRTRHGEVQPLEVLVERQREIIDVRLHTVLHGVVHKNIAEGQQRARAALRMVLAVLGMALHPRNEDVRQRHDVVDLGIHVDGRSGVDRKAHGHALPGRNLGRHACGYLLHEVADHRLRHHAAQHVGRRAFAPRNFGFGGQRIARGDLDRLQGQRHAHPAVVHILVDIDAHRDVGTRVDEDRVVERHAVAHAHLIGIGVIERREQVFGLHALLDETFVDLRNGHAHIRIVADGLFVGLAALAEGHDHHRRHGDHLLGFGERYIGGIAPDDTVVDQVALERFGVEVDRRKDLDVLGGGLVGLVGDGAAADVVGITGRPEQLSDILGRPGRGFAAQQGFVVVQAVYTVI